MGLPDPIRQRNIDLSDSLYAEFKAAAAKRQKAVYKAFAEAVEEWISRASSPSRDAVPLASEADERIVANFRKFISTEPANETLRSLKNWLRDVFSEARWPG